MAAPAYALANHHMPMAAARPSIFDWACRGVDCSDKLKSLVPLAKMTASEKHVDIGLFFPEDKAELARAHLESLKKVEDPKMLISTLQELLEAKSVVGKKSILSHVIEVDGLNTEERSLLVKTLVLLCPDLINTGDQFNSMPLNVAVKKDFREIANFLARPGHLGQGKKAEIGHISKEGGTALHTAVIWGPHIQMAHVLLSFKINIEAEDSHGFIAADWLSLKIDNLVHRRIFPKISDEERTAKENDWKTLQSAITPAGQELRNAEELKAIMARIAAEKRAAAAVDAEPVDPWRM